jgi:hypothetical protein
MKLSKSLSVNSLKYLGILILAVALSGCAAYVKPGENPATLKASVKAMVSQARVDSAKERSYRRVTGPYWVWNIYVVQSNGYYQELMPAGQGPRRWVRGTSFSDQADFLVPAGSYQVRLRVTAYMDYEIRTDGDYSIQSVPLDEWEEDIRLDAKPGGHLTVNKKYGG